LRTKNYPLKQPSRKGDWGGGGRGGASPDKRRSLWSGDWKSRRLGQESPDWEDPVRRRRETDEKGNSTELKENRYGHRRENSGAFHYAFEEGKRSRLQRRRVSDRWTEGQDQGSFQMRRVLQGAQAGKSGLRGKKKLYNGVAREKIKSLVMKKKKF